MKGETTATRTGRIAVDRSLWTDMHEFAPALENKQTPDARPTHRILRPLEVIPNAIHVLRIEYPGPSKPIRRKCLLQYVAQIVCQPPFEGKRECPFPAR